ncbi:hypothetical protein KSP39_PZI001193 [Platanthera zijinensis]|uniref:RRM domain-containing protein n=1 Tax=Platanthera zijinensis TaxID=2320716 RepID=A0AAP0GEV5_9ASPA
MLASVTTVTTAAAGRCFSSRIPRDIASLITAFEIRAPLLVRFKPSAAPPLPSLLLARRQSCFLPCSAAQNTTVNPKESVENIQDEEVNRRQLYVVNLPWEYSAADLETLFGQCGAVDGVEIIKQKNGKSRGFAFVAMSSPEDAQVAIQKLDSFELSGRIIRVELAKSFKKTYTKSNALNGSARNWIYVSNLAWKVRSGNLRDFFSTKFKPVSIRVVFDGQSGKSSGYGFVSFATNEEALAAISELNGKELMGRPLGLKISQRWQGARPYSRGLMKG